MSDATYCPHCGGDVVAREWGIRRCVDCGWSPDPDTDELTAGSHTRPAATSRATPIHAAGTAIEGPRPSSPGRPIRVCKCGCGRSLEGMDGKRRYALPRCRSAAIRQRPPMTEDEKAMYEIVRRDPCAYCGIPDDHWRSGVGADHIVPLSQGGETASTNMTACCQFCNSSKHTKSMLLFLFEGGVRR